MRECSAEENPTSRMITSTMRPIEYAAVCCTLLEVLTRAYACALTIFTSVLARRVVPTSPARWKPLQLGWWVAPTAVACAYVVQLPTTSSNGWSSAPA